MLFEPMVIIARKLFQNWQRMFSCTIGICRTDFLVSFESKGFS